MASFIFKRSLWMLLVLFVVSGITFVLMHQIPGGPFTREKNLPEAIQRNLEAKYNLNEPLHIQYFSYMGDVLIPVVTTGEFERSIENDYLVNVGVPLVGDNTTFRWMNFGPSLTKRSRTVNDIFRDNLPVSAELGFYSLIIAISIGMPLGTIAALRRNTVYDYASMGVAILGVSVPVIVLGPILRYIFGEVLRWVPPTGWADPFTGFEYKVIPAFALGFASAALIARLTRASLLQVLNEDYIRTARAKGLRASTVVIIHAMKNALIPVVTILGPLFAALITGTFVTELVFGIPGMGKYFIQSVTNRDYTVIMGTILLYAAFLVLANFLVDLIYAWLDPRIRYS